MTDHEHTYTVDRSLARLLQLGIDRDLPNHVEDWHASLINGQMSGAMVDIFVGLGWLSSARDPRIRLAAPVVPEASQQLQSGLLSDVVEVDPEAPSEPVVIEEPVGIVDDEPDDEVLPSEDEVPPDVQALLRRRAKEDKEVIAEVAVPVTPRRRRG